MTTEHRPSLLRRLFAWRARPQPMDPADMGTEIGLDYILAQASARAATVRPQPTAQGLRRWQP
jgi:hypothetical protein